MRHREGNRLEFVVFQAAQKAQRDLEMLVREDLRRSPYNEVARVSCTMNEGVLTLSGRVRSYYLKQIAQRVALDRVSGTATVVNDLRVEPESTICDRAGLKRSG